MSFRSFAVPDFWKSYEKLPQHVRELADRRFELFTGDPFNPSLGLKQKGKVWTVNIGRSYGAIALREGNVFHWVA